jgi:signal transduction histidine kinase
MSKVLERTMDSQPAAGATPRPRRRPLPLRVRLYVAATALTALAAIPLATASTGALGGVPALATTILLGVLIAAAHRTPVSISPERKVDVGTAPEVAAALLLPGPLAVVLLTAGWVAGEATRSARMEQRIFNTAVAALRASLGAATYAWLLQRGPGAVHEFLAPVATAAVMYASTTVLVRGIAAVHRWEFALPQSWLPARDLLILDGALSLTGVLAALAATQQVWALLLLGGPALIAQRMLHESLAVREQTRRAEAALAVRESFLSIAAHELRTPLTALKSFNQVAIRRLERGAAQASVLPLLGDVDAQVARMTRLVNELLDASRLATGRLTLSMAPVEIGPVVARAVALARAAAPERVIELTLPEISPIVTADAVRLEQVLTNLLENARKYSAAQSPVHVDVSTTDGLVSIAVRDHGAGIAPEEQERIFERFQRAGGLDPNISGLGLGLSIARELVVSHGGALTVASVPGEGSTFTIELPWTGEQRDAPAA